MSDPQKAQNEARRRELAFQLRPEGAPRFDYNGVGTYAAAFVICMARRKGLMDVVDLGAFIDQLDLPQPLPAIVLASIETEWQRYRKLFSLADEDELADFVLESAADEWHRSPSCNSILRLAFKVLGVESGKPGGSFAAFGLTPPSGLVAAARMRKADRLPFDFRLRGVDINQEFAAIAMMQLYLLGDNHPERTILCGNLFSRDVCERFDSIYCRPPWGTMSRFVWNNVAPFIWSEYPALAGDRPVFSSEWVFALRSMSALNPNGRAAILVSSKPLWSERDAAIRKHLLLGGRVECVISLPARMLQSTGLQPHLLVLKRPDETDGFAQDAVFVDASGIGGKARSRKILSDADIETIVAAVRSRTECREDNGITVAVRSVKELARGNAVLIPRNLIYREKKVENGVKLRELVREIRRGYPLTNDELDKLQSDKPTFYRYITMKNIQDGRIVDDLKCLSQLTNRMSNACGKPGDLIVSKIGQTIKTAVLQPKEKEKILVTNNLFDISLDTSRIDPYYLQAFFESKSGREVLERISGGNVVIHLTQNDLLETVVPCPPLERQKKIAMAFKINLDSIALLKKQLNKAVYSISTIFDKAQGED